MNEDKDLPLMSNVNDILVEHYVFDLKCNFDQKVFEGSVILRLKPASDNHCDRCREKYNSENCHKCNKEDQEPETIILSPKSNNESCSNANSSTLNMHNQDTDISKINQLNPFKCILDCQDIKIYKIIEIENISVPFAISEQFVPHDNLDLNNENCLNFSVDNWSLQIWKEEVYCAHDFPRAIRIYYSTQPKGLSLLWVKSQDGCNCVYTYGAWINNRSIFPCQEPPIAMATWEARITVDSKAVVLMSGDAEPLITSERNGHTNYYYYTKMILPMSTLALAVGYWKKETILDTNVHCQIFAPTILFDKAIEQFSSYLPCCLNSAQHYLGPYPFPRIDILFVPRGFGSLGMASPNLIFLSQSLLTSDKSTCSRLAHEIAHGWFGLLIGALDWTEEWLSEGFATFMEDIFHAHAMDMTFKEESEYCEIKFMLRLKTLKSELQHTEEELQILRPNQGEIPKEEKDGLTITYIKNGQNVQKGFLQVHYLKGYFLLSFLCKLVGKNEFIQLLKNYVQTYKGQLVESKEIFNLYFMTFPSVRNSINFETIYSKWLHCSRIPEEILNFKPSSNNQLYNNSISEFNKWMTLNQQFIRRKFHKRRKLNWENFLKIESEQLLIVLENILDEDKISRRTLRALEDVYNFKEKNADIRHRWCELIVKHHLSSGYPQIQKFLREDLAMGVYLYGELLNSNVAVERNLAKNCFHELFSEMEPNFQIMIQNMLEEN